MNVLFITHHYLSSNGGASFASRAYVNAFAEISNKITLLYPEKKKETIFPEINNKINLEPIEYKKKKLLKIFDLLTGKVHRYRKRAKFISQKEKFDLVVFDTSIVSFHLIDWFKNLGCKIIVIHHNYQYEYFRDNTKGLIKYPILFWCKRYEKEAVKKADINLTLTRQDIKLLKSNYDKNEIAKYELLGCFEYKTDKQRLLSSSLSSSPRFIITGSLDSIQTEKSLLPWLDKYYPILKTYFSNATLTIAGKSPGKKIFDKCKALSIVLIDSPTSMDMIMQNADYYICPTKLGGGIKLRIMDGLKWGLPVLTHYISARGYDTFEKQGYLFAYKDVKSFREVLQRIKTTSFNKENIYKKYQDEFSFEAGIARLRKILSQL